VAIAIEHILKEMRLYFIVLLLLTCKLYGQAPLNTTFYLDNKQISKTAKDFYNGEFKASDDTRTFSILDSLRTRNNLTRPFYIYLVSKMLDKADGTMSEELGNKCKEFVEQYPDHLIDFLYSDNPMVDKRFIDNWAKAIAEEFMIECEEQEKQCIKKSMQTTLTKIKLDNKTKLTNLYLKIENYSH
jgi:hypothetical protein